MRHYILRYNYIYLEFISHKIDFIGKSKEHRVDGDKRLTQRQIQLKALLHNSDLYINEKKLWKQRGFG